MKPNECVTLIGEQAIEINILIKKLDTATDKLEAAYDNITGLELQQQQLFSEIEGLNKIFESHDSMFSSIRTILEESGVFPKGSLIILNKAVESILADRAIYKHASNSYHDNYEKKRKELRRLKDFMKRNYPDHGGRILKEFSEKERKCKR
jgi:hypothetical protein